MELITMERYLTVEKMQEIYDAFNTLNSLLESLHISTPGLNDNTVAYNTSPAAIISKFNAVEQNIQAIEHIAESKISGYKNEFYKEFEWSSAVRDIKTEVRRWVDWINTAYSVLNQTQTVFTPLYYSDGNALGVQDGGQLYYIERKYEVN